MIQSRLLKRGPIMPPGKHILAFDQGTTSSRSIVFDAGGRIIASAQKEFAQIYPRPGWVEHDPMEIWSSQHATAAEVIAKAGLGPEDLAAVGLTNQRETTILWDKDTGRPAYNAIVWQDRRTADHCKQLKAEGMEPMVSARTGLRLDPYFSATKIRWILDHVDGARQKARDGKLLFGTVDCWLLWNLTGGRIHATDVTNASRTLLYHLERADWDDTLLELFDIPRCILPEIRSCSELYGHVDDALTPARVPIAGMAGDQHAALFGQACFRPGMIKNTYGTGCFLLMHTGNQPVHSKNNLLSTVAWKIGDLTEYALEGSVFIGGAVIQWLRDELQLVRDVGELNQLARSVPDSNGLFLVPAFTGLGAPHWDPYARGAALGMTRGTNRAHFCRAALESIAFQSADLIDAMRNDSGLELKELRVDGGAARSDCLLQFQSDLLQAKVLRPKCTETTAMGAAYLAGLAVGLWESRDSIARHWQSDASFTPQRSAAEMNALKSRWQAAVERCKGWADNQPD